MSAAGERVSQGIKERSRLLAQGGEVGADGAERVETVLAAEAARDFLLELGHADVALGLVIRKWHPMIGNKAPDLVGMLFQTRQQIERGALHDLASLPCLRRGTLLRAD